MTAKLKAEELKQKYLKLFRDDLGVWIDEHEAIQCAKLAVDELIIQLAEINNKESFNVSWYANYWQEVKQELEKM